MRGKERGKSGRRAEEKREGEKCAGRKNKRNIRVNG